MLVKSKNLSLKSVKKIIKLYENMNKRQQKDGYGKVNIPIAILKYIDDQ